MTTPSDQVIIQEGDVDDDDDISPSLIYSKRQTDLLLSLYYVTPPLSLLGSLTIIYVICRPARSLQNVNQTFLRLMLGFAVMDCLQTIMWLALGPWALPADNGIVPHATGSIATCNVKGLFMNLTFGLMLYSASLALYHAMKVVFEWQDYFVSQGFEPGFHLIAWAWPTVVAAPSIWYDNINPYDLLPGTCWITHKAGGRGDAKHADAVMREFGITTFFVSLLVTAVAFGLLFGKAKRIEARLVRISNASTNTQLSRRTGRQGMRYSLAFLLCNISWPFLVFSSNASNKEHAARFFFPLAVYSFLFTPLQGFVNAILFLSSHRTVFERNGPLGILAQGFKAVTAHKPRRDGVGTALESTTDRAHESRVMPI